MDLFSEQPPTGLEFSPIDFEKELNESQFQAVTAPPGPALVLAGAGSGKTRTLTYRVAWLLSQGVHPGEILLLTFTNKAAREMLSRVEDLTGVGGNRFWGGTFHSIGQRILRFNGKTVGFERNYNILDQGDAEALLGDTIRSADAAFLKNKNNPKAKLLLNIISYARNTRKSLEDVILERYEFFEDLIDPIQRFYRAYMKRKLEQQVADYDDLLEYWLKLLEEDAEVAAHFQNRFRHILVDEYQDTNRLQSSIVDLLGVHHQVMAVGDDAQCIYTWRGANFENIMNFPDRHPGTVIYKIETNYRSTPQILDLANGVLAAQPVGSGYHKELHPVRAPRDIPYVLPVMDGRQQAQFVIKRVMALHNDGCRLSDIAVLYRAHYQALDLQIELSRQGLPFVITSGIQFFEQAHVKDIVSQIRFVSNPQDMAAFIRFTGLLPKVGERTSARIFKQLHELAEANGTTPMQAMFSDRLKVPAAAREDWTDLAYTLKDIEEATRTRSPQDVMRVSVEGWYSGFIRTVYPNWESRLDDLESLIGFAGRYDDMTELLAQLVLLNSETSDRSVDIDDDSLRLTTVHQAKGLEYPVVFVIGLADGLFPLKRAIDEDNLEEERRLFYVAVTRAKDELYLSYPMINTQGGPSMRLHPSRFLNELPKNTYEVLRPKLQHGW